MKSCHKSVYHSWCVNYWLFYDICKVAYAFCGFWQAKCIQPILCADCVEPEDNFTINGTAYDNSSLPLNQTIRVECYDGGIMFESTCISGNVTELDVGEWSIPPVCPNITGRYSVDCPNLLLAKHTNLAYSMLCQEQTVDWVVGLGQPCVTCCLFLTGGVFYRKKWVFFSNENF